MEQAWLTPEQAGIATGAAGGALVVACAALGGVSRWLARLGRCRLLVGAAFVVLGAIGLAAAALGVYGYAGRQPAWVWCPALGLGGAMVTVLALGLPGVVLRYRRARQRQVLDDLARQLISGTSSRILARVEPRRRPG